MAVLDTILCALIKFVNMITEGLGTWLFEIIAWLIELLPSSPFDLEPVKWGEFGRLVGYLLPISKMLFHFALMLGFVAMWYTVQHILRFVKMIK